jgi:hypothetical protein
MGAYRVTSEGDQCWVPLGATKLVVIFPDARAKPVGAFQDTSDIPKKVAMIIMNYASNLEDGPRPSRQAMQDDIRRADYFRCDLRIRARDTYVIGFQTGCMAASYMVRWGEEWGAPYPYGGLILAKPFTSRTELRSCHACATKDAILNWISSLFTSGPAYHWDHAAIVQKIQQTPIVLIHDPTDPLIPYEMQRNVLQRIAPRGLTWIRGLKATLRQARKGYTYADMIQWVSLCAFRGSLYHARPKDPIEEGHGVLGREPSAIWATRPHAPQW